MIGQFEFGGIEDFPWLLAWDRKARKMLFFRATKGQLL